jgi:fumarylpyruvate hydrolase
MQTYWTICAHIVNNVGMRIPEPSSPTVAIAESEQRFPVRRIFCVGQNYADHAREMGSDSERNPPFFFTKPADAVVASGALLAYPPRTALLHHEVELVVALGAGGTDIASAEANAMIFGWGVGLDLTRRDLQFEARNAGRPWDMAKGFDDSAPVGPLMSGAPPVSGVIELFVGAERRQRGDLADMIWHVPEIIAELSTYVALRAGDLIFTGTPAGVGPIVRGDSVRGTVAHAPPIEVRFQ